MKPSLPTWLLATLLALLWAASSALMDGPDAQTTEIDVAADVVAVTGGR